MDQGRFLFLIVVPKTRLGALISVDQGPTFLMYEFDGSGADLKENVKFRMIRGRFEKGLLLTDQGPTFFL